MLDADPEHLPHRMLSDFAIYNAEARARRRRAPARAACPVVPRDPATPGTCYGPLAAGAPPPASRSTLTGTLSLWAGAAAAPAAHARARASAPPCWVAAPGRLSLPGGGGRQGMLTSLELLPMWAGVEPDVALFASGRALDEGGEWSGGHPLTEAAEGAHGPSAPTPCTAARTPAQDAGPQCCTLCQRLEQRLLRQPASSGAAFPQYSKDGPAPRCAVRQVSNGPRGQAASPAARGRRRGRLGRGGRRRRGLRQPRRRHVAVAEPGARVGAGVQLRPAVHLHPHRRRLVPPEPVRAPPRASGPCPSRSRPRGRARAARLLGSPACHIVCAYAQCSTCAAPHPACPAGHGIRRLPLTLRCTGRPQAKYAPWFGVVLKCARLAVNVLSTLSEEVRRAACRLALALACLYCAHRPAAVGACS